MDASARFPGDACGGAPQAQQKQPGGHWAPGPILWATPCSEAAPRFSAGFLAWDRHSGGAFSCPAGHNGHLPPLLPAHSDRIAQGLHLIPFSRPSPLGRMATLKNIYELVYHSPFTFARWGGAGFFDFPTVCAGF